MTNERKTLLIVDDIDVNIASLTAIFQEDYNIVKKENGKSAYDYMKANPNEIDLVLSDIVMPIMTGFELLKMIRLTPVLHNIPVIMVTGINEKDNEIKAIEYGADDIITKPFDPILMQKRVRNILSIPSVNGYHNVMEDLVIDEIDHCINSLNICTCEKCRNDLIALTLNQLKPKYVNSEKGELISKMEKLSYNSLAEITSCIANSAEIIRSKPQHK